MNFLKNNKILAIALVLIFLGGFLANVFHTSFFTVDVSRVSFETERGTITGLLYMPSGAGASNPHPVIVTTHGYLNSKEMQDLTAIEMSRRGYIVLAIDMYDHGNSRWDADIPVGGQFGTFWIHAQYSAASWAFEQPFTARDANGNGRIAVTGHSMGGFSSILAMYFDELSALQTGVRKIETGLIVGADMSFAASVAPIPQLLAGMGSRSVGFIAGMYDEFFFNSPDRTASVGGSVQEAYWPHTPAGRMFLGVYPNMGTSNTWLWADSGDLILGEDVVRGSQQGLRIVYTPNETHPWNHFSATSVNYMTQFFGATFEGGNDVAGQIWQWKVFFNFVTLIGFFMLIVPVMSLLLKLPFFNKAITEKNEPVKGAKTGIGRAIFIVVTLVGVLLPAYLIPTLMERRADNLEILGFAFVAVGIIGLFFAMYSMIKNNKNFVKGGGIIFVISLIGYIIALDHANILELSGYYVAPTINVIGYWSLISSTITAIIITGFYYFAKKPQGFSLKNYGLSVDSGAVIASAVVAFVGVAIVYSSIFLLWGMFSVDARIWTFGVRVFTTEHFMVTGRYVPVFFIFYLINAINLNSAVRSIKAKYLVALGLNTGGILLWMIIHYTMLFTTGAGWYPTMALNAILLIGLIPCLGIASVYAIKLYEKTNNVYLAAFTNSMLFTIIPVASTAVFWNLV